MNCIINIITTEKVKKKFKVLFYLAICSQKHFQ